MLMTPGATKTVQSARKKSAHMLRTRTCYNVDVEVSDHTATIEMKMWTQRMDALLRLCGVDSPERGLTAGEIDEIKNAFEVFFTWVETTN